MLSELLDLFSLRFAEQVARPVLPPRLVIPSPALSESTTPQSSPIPVVTWDIDPVHHALRKMRRVHLGVTTRQIYDAQRFSL